MAFTSIISGDELEIHLAGLSSRWLLKGTQRTDVTTVDTQ